MLLSLYPCLERDSASEQQCEHFLGSGGFLCTDGTAVQHRSQILHRSSRLCELRHIACNLYPRRAACRPQALRPATVRSVAPVPAQLPIEGSLILRSVMPRQAPIPTIRRPVGPIGSLRQKAWPKPKADRPSAPNDGESLAGIYWRLKAMHERPELPVGHPSLPTPEQPAGLEDAIRKAHSGSPSLGAAMKELSSRKRLNTDATQGKARTKDGLDDYRLYHRLRLPPRRGSLGLLLREFIWECRLMAFQGRLSTPTP